MLKYIYNGGVSYLAQAPPTKILTTLKVPMLGLICKFISMHSRLQNKPKFVIGSFSLQAGKQDTCRTCPNYLGKDVVPLLHIIKRYFKIQLGFATVIASFPFLILTIIAGLKQC